jgi:hypothetical protein
MKMQRFHRGHPLSAKQSDRLVEQVDSLARPGAAGQAQYGAAGIVFDSPRPTQLAIFELTDNLVYPDLSDASDDHLDREPTPYAPARQVWYQQHSPADQDSDGAPIGSYRAQPGEPATKVWYPQAMRNVAGYAMGTPPLGAGDRVTCYWNRQSGRWEILGEPWRVWRFELLTALLPGGTATANLLSCGDDHYRLQTEVEITVWDALQGAYWGRARNQSAAGSQGYAIYMPDADRWEILKLHDRAWRCNATLAAAMAATDGYGSVNNVVATDDGWPPVGSTADTLHVANMLGWAANIGAKCKIEFNAAGGQWEFYQVQCPS